MGRGGRVSEGLLGFEGERRGGGVQSSLIK